MLTRQENATNEKARLRQSWLQHRIHVEPGHGLLAHDIKVIDLGLRLTDVRGLGIEDLSERHNDKGSREARAANLKLNGATKVEIEFLLEWRVELNALSRRSMPCLGA
jgi:hypothetical protein